MCEHNYRFWIVENTYPVFYLRVGRDFGTRSSANTETKTCVYMNFGIYSPKHVRDLLLEPEDETDLCTTTNLPGAPSKDILTMALNHMISHLDRMLPSPHRTQSKFTKGRLPLITLEVVESHTDWLVCWTRRKTYNLCWRLSTVLPSRY